MHVLDSRLAAIEQYDVLADSDRSELRGLVELAAQICGTPMATLSIFTDTEQHHVAAYGFDGVVCPIGDSLCLSLGAQQRPALVIDSRSDPRLRTNAFVDPDGAGVRLFATEHLTTPSGVVIGSLCVADTVPGELTDSQLRGLSLLAGRVVDSLEHHLHSRELAASLGQVSHDLKTPLTSIGLSLELVHEQILASAVADDALWLLDRAIRGTTRMGTFIDRNLEFAAITGGMRTRDVNLEEILGDVVSDLQGALLDVELDVRGTLPIVEVDPVHLRSVLQNLIHNAAKYRDPERSPRITVRSSKTEHGWRIEVEDNGSGLSSSDRVRVFEPHARAHEEVGGSGLGLDTARRLIEAHGGSIGLDAAPGHGLVAWFEIPD